MKFVNNASDTGILGLRRHVFDTLQSIEYAEVKSILRILNPGKQNQS